MSEAAAAAPAAAPANGAPGGATQPPAAANGAAPANQPPADDRPEVVREVEAVLKKHGGLTYKGSGKEHRVADVASLTRLLSRAHAVDSTAEEATKLRQVTEERERLREQLKGERDPMRRFELLRQLAGEEVDLDEVSEARVRARYEEAQKRAGMSERERQLAEELERQRAENEQWRKSQEQQKQQAEQQEYQAQVAQLTEGLAQHTHKALVDAKVAPEHAYLFVPAVAAALHRAKALKLDVSPDELAGTLTGHRQSLAVEWLKMSTPEGIISTLESAGLMGQLRQALHQHLKAKVSGGQPVVQQAQPKPAPASKVDMGDFFRSR